MTQVFPDNNTYTPVWDVHPAVWTQAAINAGLRVQVRHEADVTTLVQQGLLVSGGNGIANTSLGGLRSSGQISNCPIISPAAKRTLLSIDSRIAQATPALVFDWRASEPGRSAPTMHPGGP